MDQLLTLQELRVMDHKAYTSRMCIWKALEAKLMLVWKTSFIIMFKKQFSLQFINVTKTRLFPWSQKMSIDTIYSKVAIKWKKH